MNSIDMKFKESIINVLESKPDGATQKAFEEALPDIPIEILCSILTELTAQSITEGIQLKGMPVMWKLKTSNIKSMESKLTPDEASINRQIRNSGSKGISRTLLKKNFSLKESDFVKIEKRLLDIGLITQYSFNNSKIYVASDVVPDSSYSAKLFVMENKKTMESRVSELRAIILEFLKMKFEKAVENHQRIQEQYKASAATLQSILEHIERTCGIKMKKQELRLIIESLVNSEDIVSVDQSHTVKQQLVDDYEISNLCYKYRAPPTQTMNTFAVCPTILCPHKDYCIVGREICPENCPYMAAFLKMP